MVKEDGSREVYLLMVSLKYKAPWLNSRHNTGSSSYLSFSEFGIFFILEL